MKTDRQKILDFILSDPDVTKVLGDRLNDMLVDRMTKEMEEMKKLNSVPEGCFVPQDEKLVCILGPVL
jgi:hypothetical protein